MKIALLGTGLGQAHASVLRAHPDVDDVIVFGRTPAKLAVIAAETGFATTTDLDSLYVDPTIDLVDICLPTPLHAEHAVRALEAGKDVLCQLPLATAMADAHRVIEAEQCTGRRVFVDMFPRFNPANTYLSAAVAEGRYGTLKSLEIEIRTSEQWPGYDRGFDTMAVDILHQYLDIVVGILGRPETVTAVDVAEKGRGSAGEVLLTYPGAIARCGSSSIMPTPHGSLESYRATFTDGVLEMTTPLGSWDWQSDCSTLTEFTEQGVRIIDPPATAIIDHDLIDSATLHPQVSTVTNLTAAMIDHVLACLNGRETSRVSAESVLDTLQLTLDIRDGSHRASISV
ncbi:Gfo/Idh/MocA family oxidoreductase [Nocardia sp. NPDC046473]|uniref:Gfo/Idh/MocA family protein n=1 Tax=Nocardia sp. NPDC046473 TaxID=3155733 RepID=UPI0033FE112B